MPITRKIVAQDDSEDNQWLKMDSTKRYIECDGDEWQFLFGPNSLLSVSTQILKIGAEFNVNSFDGLRLTAYLYNPATGGVDSSASCTFNVYVVRTPDWTDVYVDSFTGVSTPNQYYFKEVTAASIPSIDLFGGDTVMVEAVITRLSETYRDRIYVNHLGIYDNVDRLRKDVDFLDITKLDE